MNKFISLILIHLTVEWQVIESAFYGEPMQNTSDWVATYKKYSRRFLDGCDDCYEKKYPSVKTCYNNPQQFIGLNKTIYKLEKTFQASHYELMLVNNLFFFTEDEDYSFELKISTNEDNDIYSYSSHSDTSTSQKKICSKSSNSIYYKYKTLVKNETHKDYQFTLNFRYKPCEYSNEVGINNVFIYIKPCHYSCKECSGPQDNQCTECYWGDDKNGKCVCADFLLKDFGCIKECPNQKYLADGSSYCQYNTGVQSLSTSFTTSAPKSSDWQGYSDLSDKPILECQNKSKKYQVVGPFSGIDGFSYIFQNVNARVGIRLRITFTFLNFQLNSALLIFFDDILQAQITRTAKGYEISKGKLILNYNSTCQNQDGYVGRYETILNSYFNTPVLKVFGTYLTSNEQWAFHNVTMDTILCGLYCASCYDDFSCLTCISGYYLHKHTCVKSCPPHSVQNALICVDYDVNATLSHGTYIVKAFYDFNTSIDDLSSIIGTPGWTSVTGQYFSFYPTKIILGGPLIWKSLSQNITKVFSIPNTHDQVRLMFQVIFGDFQSGSSFECYIDGAPLTLPLNSGTNNYVGDSENDQVSIVDTTFGHSTSSLSIKFVCNPNSVGFCGISDYYIITFLNTPCTATQYYNGLQCTTCPQECSTCDSATQCTSCSGANTMLVRGQCICIPPHIKDNNACVSCDSSCETCFGLGDTQCITCNPSRKLSNHKCVCGDGYYGNNLGQCESVCGDGVKVSAEQCDDGNNNNDDGCDSNCKLECQKQCTQCNQGICNECNTQYWQLISNLHVCQPICGDGYAVQGIEECDTNDDSCINCILTCQDVCTSCQQGLCYDCNTVGWTLEQNKCVPQCGDGLIIGNEQCEDMNEIQYDGCYQCKFQCDNFCTNCVEGICYDCQIGRYVIDNQCITQCGDGIYVQTMEQCDDGNLDNQDGCNQYCQIENNWQCNNINEALSQCFNIIQPEFNIQVLTLNPSNEQSLIVTFTMPVRSTVEKMNEMDKQIVFSIEGLNFTYYLIDYKINNETEITTTQNLQFNISIIFFQPCDSPTFTVFFGIDLFVTEYGIPLLQNKKTKTLKTPMMLSNQQKLVAETTEKFNTAIIYCLLSVAAFCIITGSFDMFWNLMDQLQYISYLKYANVAFPANLNIFFNSFDLITLDPILKLTGLDQLINAIDGPDEYVINPPEKFMKDGVNAYFLSNFSSSIFCILTAYISLAAANICIKVTNRVLEPYSEKMGLRLTKFLKFCQKLSRILIKSFYYNGLLRLVMSNCYDCSFSSYIQINNYQQNGDIFTNLNYFMALGVALGQGALTMLFIQIAHSFHSNKTIKKQKNFDSIFDGVKPKQDFWITQYNSVYLIKKQIFIFIIVFMYQNGSIQTLGIGINQLIFTFYMVLNKPLENNNEYYKTIVTESIIVFISTTFAIYPLREGLQISLDTYIIIGWIHIGSFCSILGFSLIIDGLQQLQSLKEKFYKNVDIKNSSQTMFY